MKRCHLVISGRVQGVGYRYSTAREAARLAVSGWVRNRSDGCVEALVEGEEHAVDALVAWCRQGPMGAVVTDVEVEVLSGKAECSSFSIRY